MVPVLLVILIFYAKSFTVGKMSLVFPFVYIFLLLAVLAVGLQASEGKSIDSTRQTDDRDLNHDQFTYQSISQ